jgi:hypothetical protein
MQIEGPVCYAQAGPSVAFQQTYRRDGQGGEAAKD